MRNVATALLCLGVFAGCLQAQRSNGYAFFAPGGVTCCGQTAMTLHFGAGGEAILWKGLGAGVEIGAVGTRENFGNSVMGLVSPNGYYHFTRRHERRSIHS